ncbi:Hypothetical protein CINCED_3A004723 [Cinara cedri]|nr:Hypothetical protein CINCED_3A004723 [Cinara cedri]
MKYKKTTNIVPAGFESDEEYYDEFGNYHQKPVYKPQAENFQLTLQHACISNNVPEIIRALNSKSLNINCHLQNNWTPLMFAAFYGSFDAVTYLLENGADPAIHFDCHNVIMCVCNCKSVNINELDLVKCLNLFLSFNNIDINSKDTSGMTALMFACSNGWLKLVEYLVNDGADIEIVDNQNGETALFFAIRFNHFNIVKFLLSRGANKDATDKRNHTVYRIVESKNMSDMLNLLNGDVEQEQLPEFIFEEQTCWDIVIAELENGFPRDAESFLNALSMKQFTSTLKSNKTTFKQLLTWKSNVNNNVGITLTPHQKLLTTALKCFHTRNWSNQSLGMKRQEINAETIAHILAGIVRQLHVLDATLIYLESQSYILDQKKGREAIHNLMMIKYTKDKILKLLSDKEVRVSKSDYIGPCKVKTKKKKNINDIVFFGAAVLLVLLRIV